MDLFSGKKTKCPGCGNKISSNEPSVEALKKKYHTKCFVCANCKKQITGEFHPVKSADGKEDQPWDEECYVLHKAPKCDGCGAGIADKRIKTDDGRVFHEACLAQATQGSCDACGRPIGLTEPVTEALGKNFHKDCFRCGHCGGELASEFHVDENNKPVCKKCVKKEKKMSDTEREVLHEEVRVEEIPDQAAGSGPTTETFVRSTTEHDRLANGGVPQAQYLDRNGQGWFGLPAYRPTNLRVVANDGDCNVCAAPIVSGTRVEARGNHFHDDCFNQIYSGECSGCQQKIGLTEPSVTVPQLGRDWHNNCLNCTLCNNTISGGFHLKNGAPACDVCYVDKLAPVCAGCQQPVNDPQLKAMKQIWHPDCFSCDVCHEPLYKFGNEFFNVEGKPYCGRDIEAAHIKVM